ncbi:hypothetical protein COOONC_00210 [Cooperia oncophora]
MSSPEVVENDVMSCFQDNPFQGHHFEPVLYTLRGSSVQSEDRSPPAYDSDLGFTERTPLLAPCRSLPSVVGYDSARSVYDYPGPSTARSEDGRTETRRRKKRMRKLHRIQAHKMR